MKKYIFLLGVLTVSLLLLGRAGFGALPFEGQWSASGVAGLEGHGFYLDYAFWAGTYSMEGYPPISESGVYEVVFSETDEFSSEYVLKMTPHEGDPEPGAPYLLGVELYADGSMNLETMSSVSRGYTFYKS